MDAVAGVDIGGTKTHLMLGRDGAALAERIVETDGWRQWDVRADAAAIVALVSDLAADLPIEALAVGAHGCDDDRACHAMAAALHDALVAAGMSPSVTVVNDSELLVPAAGFDGGVGLVCGTGSIAVARAPDGRMLAAGGWGWILGDEGSAAALVREAARAVRGALDRGEDGDPLVAALMAALQTDDPTKLGRLLDAVRGAASWGRHASAVFSAAEAGSGLAATVIRDGGRALAGLVGVLAARGADADRVVAAGGVIVEQPSLLAAFVDALADIRPGAHVTLLRDPPVRGAVALAARAAARQRQTITA